MKCLICLKTELYGESYKRHMDAHFTTMVDPSKYSCSKCKRKFRRRDRWKKHILAQKCREKVTSQPICRICNSRFYSHQTLQRHMQTHQSNMFTCSSCSREFRSESKLQRHKKSKTCIKKYPCCPVCDRVFKCKQTVPRSESPEKERLCKYIEATKAYVSQYVKPTNGTEAQQRISNLLEKYFRGAVVTYHKSSMWNTIMNHIQHKHGQDHPELFYWAYCTPISIIYNAFERVEGETDDDTRVRFQASVHPDDQVFINRLYNRDPMLGIFSRFLHPQTRSISELQELSTSFNSFEEPYLRDLDSRNSNHTTSQEYQYWLAWNANPPHTTEDALEIQKQYLTSIQHRFQFIPELKPRWSRIVLFRFGKLRDPRYHHDKTAMFDTWNENDEYGMGLRIGKFEYIWKPYEDTGLVDLHPLSTLPKI